MFEILNTMKMVKKKNTNTMFGFGKLLRLFGFKKVLRKKYLNFFFGHIWSYYVK